MFAARAGGTRRVCIRNVVLIDGTPVRTPARRRGAFNPTIHTASSSTSLLKPQTSSSTGCSLFLNAVPLLFCTSIVDNQSTTFLWSIYVRARRGEASGQCPLHLDVSGEDLTAWAVSTPSRFRLGQRRHPSLAHHHPETARALDLHPPSHLGLRCRVPDGSCASNLLGDARQTSRATKCWANPPLRTANTFGAVRNVFEAKTTASDRSSHHYPRKTSRAAPLS